MAENKRKIATQFICGRFPNGTFCTVDMAARIFYFLRNWQSGREHTSSFVKFPLILCQIPYLHSSCVKSSLFCVIGVLETHAHHLLSNLHSSCVKSSVFCAISVLDTLTPHLLSNLHSSCVKSSLLHPIGVVDTLLIFRQISGHLFSNPLSFVRLALWTHTSSFVKSPLTFCQIAVHLLSNPLSPLI